MVRFYSVQSAADRSRLEAGGEPWPTAAWEALGLGQAPSFVFEDGTWKAVLAGSVAVESGTPT